VDAYCAVREIAGDASPLRRRDRAVVNCEGPCPFFSEYTEVAYRRLTNSTVMRASSEISSSALASSGIRNSMVDIRVCEEATLHALFIPVEKN
jgi:hypothetical protein